MGINWIEKGNSRSTARADVSIRLNKSGHGDNQERIIARFDVETAKKLSAKSAYLMMGYDKETGRIYFKEDGPINGFKLSWTNTGHSKMQISCPTVDALKKHVGDYQLLFDKEEKLYYIDTNKTLI